MKNNCNEECNVKLTFWFCLFVLLFWVTTVSCQSITLETHDCNTTKSHLRK